MDQKGGLAGAKAEVQGVRVSLAELVKLCAVDDDLFARTFFPQATRQKSPKMHAAVDGLLNDPKSRLLNVILPRDFAKTTKLRMFAAKRIAYGLSRTILYVAASEIKATQNIQWLRNRLEEKLGADGKRTKPLLASVYGLDKGKKWTETELEIQHRLLAHPIWVLGVGITSDSIRGINFDDYRPDLIILDDVLTDENAASKEQREKINALIMGAVKNSLAPIADDANAKIVALNTPQHSDDFVARAEKDTEWKTARYSCWTKETESLPTEFQVSAWPERHPTEQLRREKLAAVSANRLSIFIREKECKVVARETCMFLPEWLQFYSEAPASGITVLAIDPVPPPTPGMEKRRELSTDFEAQGVWRRYGDKFYLLEMSLMRGHQPNFTASKFFELAMRWRINWAIIESVAAQKYLKYILEQEMIRRKQWFNIQLFEDIRSKTVRINSILSGPASNGRLFVRAEHAELIQQFTDYPNVEHDDALDMAAIGVSSLLKPWMDSMDDKGFIDNSTVPKLRLVRGCP